MKQAFAAANGGDGIDEMLDDVRERDHVIRARCSIDTSNRSR